jgi:hypothetical protein
VKTISLYTNFERVAREKTDKEKQKNWTNPTIPKGIFDKLLLYKTIEKMSE